MRDPRLLGTAGAAGLLAGAAFWLACGPRFEYMVYSGGVAWHAETFTPYGTFLMAAMLGAAVAVCVAAALWIRKKRVGAR